MRAYRLVEWEQPPQFADVPDPTPGPGQVVVKVAGNGLCHSDATMRQMPGAIGEAIGWSMPFTLGHEVAGWISDTGAGVDGFAEGDPVALVSPHSCGRCHYCLRGLDSACVDGLAGRGYGRDGGLAEYVLVDSVRDLLPLRTLDPLAAAPLTDAGATSYHAVRRALPRLFPGAAAVVIGAGGLGAYAVQFLKALSAARVVAVDANPARLDYARELGADETLDGVKDSTAADLLQATGGGAAVVLDFVGIDASINAGMSAVRPAGAFGLVGAGGGTLARPWYGGLPRDGEVFNFQGSTIADAQEVIALAESGAIRSDVDLFGFDDVEVAYAKLDAGELRGRAVVRPGAAGTPAAGSTSPRSGS